MPLPENPVDDSPESRHTQMVEEGLRLYKLNNYPAAGRTFQEILREDPKHADALHLLGLTAIRQGNLSRAEKLVRAAIAASEGRIANFHNSLGNLLREQQELEAAQNAYEVALQLDPQFIDAWLNLALLARQPGGAKSDAAAVDVLRRAVDAAPDHPRLLEELGDSFVRLNQFGEAIPLLQRLVQLTPNSGKAWFNLGIALDSFRQHGAAINAMLKSIHCDPDHSSSKLAMAQLMTEISAPHEAEAMLISGIHDGTATVDAYGTLGNVYKSLGYIDLALDCYAKALDGRPSVPDHQNFLYTLLYDPLQNDHEVADDHRLWATQYAAPHYPTDPFFRNNLNPDRPLRIGYVSGHFWDHAVAMFSFPMIQVHDRQQFELYFYSSGVEKDWLTEAFQSCAKQWRDISALDDDAAAALVRENQIDILVDLAGHIGGNRLLLFARKPAPIQVTYLGYQATTGMEVMDYRLTDAIADPPGVTDRYYVEELIRLNQFFVYRPSDYAPSVSALPAESNGYITFGCLNTPTKTGEGVVALWAQILHAVPGSRILLLAPSGLDADPRVEQLFLSHGIEKDRLSFVGKRPRPVYLEQFSRIDIGLDPFPFSGHTTTCDALWQGVPVITLAGKTYAGRMCTSTLHQATLADCAVETPDAYVQRAVELAADLTALAEMRRIMRERLRASPMLDAKRFVTSLEAAYRSMWRRWCTTHGNQPHSAG